MYMFIKSLKLRDTISFKRIFRNLDVLVIENYLILKNNQEDKLKNIYVREFESD